MEKLEIWIEQGGEGKQIAGRHTKVYLLRRDVDGDEEHIDISSLVRGVDVHLHVDEPITARMEVFITGVKTRAQVEDLVLNVFKPRRWWQRWSWPRRDVTTLNSVAREYAQ